MNSYVCYSTTAIPLCTGGPNENSEESALHTHTHCFLKACIRMHYTILVRCAAMFICNAHFTSTRLIFTNAHCDDWMLSHLNVKEV